MKRFIYMVKTSILPVIFALLTAACGLDTAGQRYSIKGKVLDSEGKGVSGVEISASGISSTAKTSSDGTYKLEGLSHGSYAVKAKKAGYNFIPDYSSLAESSYSGNIINIAASAKNGVVYDVNFDAKKGVLTISDIQGSSLESPLKDDEVQGIRGVVTMICHRVPHVKYDTVDYNGENVPQWLGCDGFFMEALPEEKDLSGTKSNGIFVNTHDPAYDDTQEGHWLSGIPSDLKAGDVVFVNGTVKEVRHLNRYGTAEGVLSRTEIIASSVVHSEENGVVQTAPYPDGVLLTTSRDRINAWLLGHEKDGFREARTLIYDTGDLKKQIAVLESVEAMVIRIEDPLVVGATYYNLTSVLPDGGKIASGDYPKTFNEKWSGDVIWENEDGVQDFNEEILFVDYQAPDWTTFYPITQIGDYLVNLKESDPKASERIFYGVMDYTVDGVYMAQPLNHEKNCFLFGASLNSYIAPYCVSREDAQTLTTVTGETIYDQGWNFDTSDAWYQKDEKLKNVAKNMTGTGQGTNNSGLSGRGTDNVIPVRTGNWESNFDVASELFVPAWKNKASATDGNTDLNSITVAAFNIENYEAQGSANNKQENVALVIKNNLLYPDVLIIVEMGDDKSTQIYYDNQDNSWAEKDGNVTAVRNFSGIIDVIKQHGGPQYDFRCIDPKEHDSGGKPGVNIRVGILYNTKRVTPRDAGRSTNTYLSTHGEVSSGGSVTNAYGKPLLPEQYWPVQTSNHHAQGWTLAEINASVYKGADGKPHLSQSPSYIQSSYFEGSRRPIACEFVVNNADGTPSDQNFFVVGCHLGSKRGDYPLYGSVQPPLLLSEVKRNGQARTVNNFVQSVLTIDGDAKVIVGGDMNDFAYSTPQKILKGEIGKNQILFSLAEELMPVQEQFSYTFQGNLQEIDHLFVTSALFEKAKQGGAIPLRGTSSYLDYKNNDGWKNFCFIPHINSMFTRNNHVNLSDHDPDIVHIPGVFDVE